MRDAPWEDIFKLGASAAASEFYEWVQVEIDVYISPCKYQVKPHSSPWFFIKETFAELLMVFSTKVNLLYLLYSSLEMLCSASDKAKLFAQNFSKNSYLKTLVSL